MTPAGTSNELDVQNGWEENTHTHPVYNSIFQIFDYLRAVVYNLHNLRAGVYAVYKIIFSTGAATTVTNVLLPIEIHVVFFGLQATHKLPQSSHHHQPSTVRCSNAVVKITNSNKGTDAVSPLITGDRSSFLLSPPTF